MADLSLGILIDIVDEDWMRDTLPEDGTFFLFLFLFYFILPFPKFECCFSYS
jgi:anaphase-promoting complex subunit 13